MDRVVDHDGRLLRLGPSERAVAHRLAVYLEQEFPDSHVDCEYNRRGDEGDRKQITINRSGNPSDADPDIVIHMRGPKGPNLLAVEVKPASASDKKMQKDRAKLRAYLSEHDYAYAVFIVYDAGGHYEPERI